MDSKTVLYAATRGIYHDLEVCLKSLMFNTSVDKIYIMIEDDVFPSYLPDCVEVINVRNQTYIQKTSPNYNVRWTYMVLMRPLASKYLRENKVISLDCDTLFFRNGDEIFDIDVSDHYYAASVEPGDLFKPVKPYYNFGVAVLNLDRIRQDHMDDLYLTLINSGKYDCAEQDVMSIICSGKILQLDPKFNSNHYTCMMDESEVIIRHYAAEPAWQSCSLYEQYQTMPWSYVENQWRENRIKKGV